MKALLDSQVALATRLMQEYLAAGPDKDTGKSPVKESVALDEDRRQLIRHRLLPVVTSFLEGTMALEDFKPEIDRINKQHELWGFKGIKGQMFFNLAFNAAEDIGELTAELQAAIAVPETEDIARSRIRTFSSYVRRIGDALVEAGGSKHARPKLSSVPFFLSYFWQIQSPEVWAVYYTNSVQVLTDLNLLEPLEDLSEAYIQFQQLHVRLQEVFSRAGHRPFTLYDVEHVWWYIGKRKQEATAQVPTLSVGQVAAVPAKAETVLATWPDSYVPPIVAVLPRLAANDALLEAAAKASGTSIARAFEKNINAAFTILGFETQLLGQGAGRVQDGLALAPDESYAILWDAKARQGAYRMGTDDRVIREYVMTQSREIKKRRHLRNLYYFIVSSDFQDEFDDLIRGLKMDTNINEVCLVEAEALVVMVDAKLRDPRQFSLGPDGIQRLFCQSGILTAQAVREALM
jgi:hypothetical protein